MCLLSRGNVDRKRIAFVGHSYKRGLGALLSGVDRRFKAFVLMAGFDVRRNRSTNKRIQQFRQRVGPEKVDAFHSENCLPRPGQYVTCGAGVVFSSLATQESSPDARTRPPARGDRQRA